MDLLFIEKKRGFATSKFEIMRGGKAINPSQSWLLAFRIDEIPEDVQQQINSARNSLDLKDVDYEATMETKVRIARQIYDRKDKILLQVSKWGRPGDFTLLSNLGFMYLFRSSAV